MTQAMLSTRIPFRAPIPFGVEFMLTNFSKFDSREKENKISSFLPKKLYYIDLDHFMINAFQKQKRCLELHDISTFWCWLTVLYSFVIGWTSFSLIGGAIDMDCGAIDSILLYILTYGGNLKK